jgi:hypothetical protein
MYFRTYHVISLRIRIWIIYYSSAVALSTGFLIMPAFRSSSSILSQQNAFLSISTASRSAYYYRICNYFSSFTNDYFSFFTLRFSHSLVRCKFLVLWWPFSIDVYSFKIFILEGHVPHVITVSYYYCNALAQYNSNTHAQYQLQQGRVMLPSRNNFC